MIIVGLIPLSAGCGVYSESPKVKPQVGEIEKL